MKIIYILKIACKKHFFSFFCIAKLLNIYCCCLFRVLEKHLHVHGAKCIKKFMYQFVPTAAYKNANISLSIKATSKVRCNCFVHLYDQMNKHNIFCKKLFKNIWAVVGQAK